MVKGLLEVYRDAMSVCLDFTFSEPDSPLMLALKKGDKEMISTILDFMPQELTEKTIGHSCTKPQCLGTLGW